MKSKVSMIRDAWATGDRIGALRIASRFFDRSQDTLILKRGMDAWNNPDFYRQIGRDPERLTAEAIELLATKFRLDEPAGDAGPRDGPSLCPLPVVRRCRPSTV